MPLFKKKPVLPDYDSLSLDQLLFEADTKEDPQLIYAALSRAERLEPENLDIQRRLLLHGRLHERSNKNLDFSIIKCHLLHAFEHPEKHPEEALRRMHRELFDEERLQKCLALAGDGEAFQREYLEELSKEYILIFLAPDSSHAPRVFGLSFKGSLQKYLAAPARDIISNILSSPFLSGAEAILLAKAFYRAFYEYAHGDVRELDSRLGAEIRAQLR